MRNFWEGNRIWVTTHSDGTKMEGIQSISTSCLANPICEARRKIEGSVCQKCYADSLGKMRKSLTKHLVDNMDILSKALLPERIAALVPISTVIARIESFGDVMNVTQARNYIRIIRTHKATKFGIWSKNLNLWGQAFEAEGKPRNCTYVHSSAMVDIPDFILPRWRKYVDHVFTVWSHDIYDANYKGTPSECAGIRCMNCLKCYKRGGQFYINERLR